LNLKMGRRATLKLLHAFISLKAWVLFVNFFCSCWVEMLVFICQMPFRHSGFSVLFSWAYSMYYISLAAWNIGNCPSKCFQHISKCCQI
jgi:hypothetical protein